MDLPPTGFSQGDEAVFHDVLKQEGDVIGHDGGVCSITSTAGSGEVQCLVTIDLPEGRITSQGLATGQQTSPRGSFTVPLTGGSGVYQNVGGQATVATVSNTVARVTIHLIVP